MRRVLGCLGTFLLLLVMAPTSASAAPAPPSTTAARGTVPKAWILVDADSGTVLAGTAVHTPLPPASTVKIMTAITAVEILKANASVKVSANAANREAMKIDMRAGESWPLDQALQSLLMVSANDAAYAIAETAGGSLDGFADRMQATAARLGMRDSTFTDPAGLDDANSFRGGSQVSAYDLAIAGRNLLSVPRLAEIVRTKRSTFVDPRGGQRSLPNHNTFLSRYEGGNGLKTGYTRNAGRTLVASATRNGRTMIAVVIDVNDHYGWAGRLLDQGFATPRNARGTGEQLPDPDIAVGGRTVAPTTAPSDTPASKLDTRVINATRSAPSWLLISLAVVGGLILFVLWRRHVVKARRRARQTRADQVAAAQRRRVRSVIDHSETSLGTRR